MYNDAEESMEQQPPSWRRPCPDCDGTGVVCWIDEDEDGTAEHGHRPCWFCRGKGMVDVD